MKYSIITSAPLRAFFLGAYLLAPRAVQSEQVFLDDINALAPGIDRLVVDATTRRLQMNLQHRSLELDPFFNEFVDDDTTLEYLAGIDIDETLVQCMKDVDTFYNETPAILEDLENFSKNATTTTNSVDTEILEVTVEYSEESRQIIRQKCADAGGYFEILTGELKCTILDLDANITVEQSISGYVNCMANTMSCASTGRPMSIEFSMLRLEARGRDCELTGSPAALDNAGGKSATSSLTFAGLLVAVISFAQM